MRHLFIIIVTMGSAIAGESTVIARSSPPLGDLIAQTLADNPRLEAAYEEYRAAAQRPTQAGALPDPMLSWTHFATPIQTRTGAQENIFSLSQNVPWFGKLRLAREVAESEAEAARLRYESLRLDLTRDVGIAYYDAALLARQREILGELSELLEGVRPVVRERIRTGGQLSTELRLDLEIERLRARLESLAAQYDGKTAMLLSFVEEPSSKALSVPAIGDSDLKVTSFSTLVKPTFDEHPDLLALDRAIAAATSRKSLAAKAGIPDPTLGVAVHDIDGSRDDAVGLSLGFRLPLARKKYRAAREEAAAVERAAIARRQDAQNRLAAEWLGAVAELEAAFDTVERYSDHLIPAADDIFETAQTDYEAGKITLVELIEDEKTVLEVRLGYWSAVADAHRSWVTVQTLTANPNLP